MSSCVKGHFGVKRCVKGHFGVKRYASVHFFACSLFRITFWSISHLLQSFKWIQTDMELEVEWTVATWIVGNFVDFLWTFTHALGFSPDVHIPFVVCVSGRGWRRLPPPHWPEEGQAAGVPADADRRVCVQSHEPGQAAQGWSSQEVPGSQEKEEEEGESFYSSFCVVSDVDFLICKGDLEQRGIAVPSIGME